MSENLPDNNQPAQPVYPAQPAAGMPGVPGTPGMHAAPAYGAVPAKVPGKTLGIAGLILAFLFSIVGLILSVVALAQSRKAGASNVPAVIGIVVGALGTIGWIFGIIVIAGLISSGLDVAQQCRDGAYSVMVAGQEVLCSTVSY